MKNLSLLLLWAVFPWQVFSQVENNRMEGMPSAKMHILSQEISSYQTTVYGNPFPEVTEVS